MQMKFGTLKPRVQATKPTPRPMVNTDIIIDSKLSLEQICEGKNSARTKEPLSKENHNHMLVDKYYNHSTIRTRLDILARSEQEICHA